MDVTDQTEGTVEQGKIAAKGNSDSGAAGLSASKNVEKDRSKVLSEVGLSEEQVNKLVESGVVIPVPKSIDDLPETIRSDIDKKIREELVKSEETIKSQLYKTIEKQKSDIEKLMSVEEERRRKIAEEEAERKRKEEEEAQKRMTLEEKLQQQSEATKKIIDEMSKTYEEKISSITRQMEVEKLSILREKLIAENNIGELDVFIPDPASGQPVTEDDIRKAVDLAKERLNLLKKEKPETQTPSRSVGTRVPSGSGHLIGQGIEIDEQVIKQASKSELEKIKEQIWNKYADLMG